MLFIKRSRMNSGDISSEYDKIFSYKNSVIDNYSCHLLAMSLCLAPHKIVLTKVSPCIYYKVGIK